MDCSPPDSSVHGILQARTLQWVTISFSRPDHQHPAKALKVDTAVKREILSVAWGFPGGSDGKESVCNAKDLGSIPGLGRSPGEENSNPLQYSCLETSTDRGTWRATVHRVAESWTRLSDFYFP
ncbi:unnamed protein product [Rangifer tarandus platyrhynchus]|uniref:Uncharacterized protein n=2 Tax=Rangifer tarandus platyrhynchus TaxID=3082113 RepID=A0ABN8XXC3_RANTA|nr:unnamed protein product [Rangifer tarandus platyrhynchus]